jgi:hypothetical protein
MISTSQFTRSILTITSTLGAAVLFSTAVRAAPPLVCTNAHDVYLRDWPNLKPIKKLNRSTCFGWQTVSNDWVLVIGKNNKIYAISKNYLEFVCSKCKRP